MSLLQRPPLRTRLREIMEPYTGEADASTASLVVDLLVLVLITASCVLVPFQWFHPEHGPLLDWLEYGFTAVFVVEYLLRWYASENRLRHPFTWLALLDLLAILPTLLMLTSELLLLRSLRAVRLLRLLRLLRLVRLLRYLRYGPLIVRGLIQARIWLSATNEQYRLAQLGRVFLAAVVAWFVGSTMLYITETRLMGHSGPFASYAESLWHMIIVLVSGIEDKEPLSWLGRLEITALMVVGIVLVGLLTGEIVSILVQRTQRAGKVQLKPSRGRFARHIVVLGLNPHLDPILRQLYAALHGEHHMVVVHPDAGELPVSNPQVYRRVFAVAGQPLEAHVLARADLDTAARVIVLASEPDQDPAAVTEGSPDNQALMATVAMVCRKRRIPLVVQLVDPCSLRYTRHLTGVAFVLGQPLAERLLGRAVRDHGITAVIDELLTYSPQTNELYAIAVPDGLAGRTFAEAQRWFVEHDEVAATLLGWERRSERDPARRFVLAPAATESGADARSPLEANDRLLVFACERPRLPGAGDGDDPFSTTTLFER